MRNDERDIPQCGTFAIIVAGGKGLRMGGPLPKQFIEVGGRPILMHTIDRFREALPGVSVVLVLPRGQQGFWAELCRRHGFAAPALVADGGPTRFHSVRSGLALIPGGADGVVGVHDGVRPFASVATIRACYAAALRTGAAIPVVPVVETLRHIGGHTVPRGDYRLVQTPQAFGVGLLRQAYSQPYCEGFTDDASGVEAAGHAVTLVDGNRENIKITTPSDLAVAEALLCRRGGAGAEGGGQNA